MPYPGGPWLAKLAEGGDPAAFKLPRPLLHSGDLDFSFAGLKTAVLTQAKKLGGELEARKADLAASTQAAIVEVLLKKSMKALEETGLKRLVVAGGVGANRALREDLNAACAKRGVRVHYPELHLCTDNGAMIAMAAAMRLQSGLSKASERYAFDVKPRWPMTDLVTANAVAVLDGYGDRAQLIASCATLLTGTRLPSLSVNTPFSSLASLALTSISSGSS